LGTHLVSYSVGAGDNGTRACSWQLSSI